MESTVSYSRPPSTQLCKQRMEGISQGRQTPRTSMRVPTLRRDPHSKKPKPNIWNRRGTFALLTMSKWKSCLRIDVNLWARSAPQAEQDCNLVVNIYARNWNHNERNEQETESRNTISVLDNTACFTFWMMYVSFVLQIRRVGRTSWRAAQCHPIRCHYRRYWRITAVRDFASTEKGR